MAKSDQERKIFEHGDKVASGLAGQAGPDVDWSKEWRILAGFTDVSYRDERFALINVKVGEAERAYRHNDVVTFRNIRDQIGNIYLDEVAGQELAAALRAIKRYRQIEEEVNNGEN